MSDDPSDNPDVPRERLGLPAGVHEVRRTPIFDVASVPPALLDKHHTSVWAQLVVTAGVVGFEEFEPAWQTEVTAEGGLVLIPDRVHRIAPSADAQFHVRFYREATD